MRKIIGVAALAVLGLASTSPAMAQFSMGHPNSRTYRKAGDYYYGGVGLFPIASFGDSGLYSSGVSGTQTLIGELVSIDLGVMGKGGAHTRYEIGSWYWTGASKDLYEVHFRVLTVNGLGIQAGIINTSKGFFARPGDQNTKTDENSADLFLLYDISSDQVVKFYKKVSTNTSTYEEDLGREERYHRWDIQIGTGLYFDNTPHINNSSSSSPNSLAYGSSVNMSLFVTASLQIKKNVSLVLSEWYYRDRYQDLNRVALGLGISF